jgi:hypothetical protein
MSVYSVIYRFNSHELERGKVSRLFNSGIEVIRLE